MFGKNSYNMPIGLAMSFSSEPEAFKRFLEMPPSEQDKIIEASYHKSIRELYLMVSSLKADGEQK